MRKQTYKAGGITTTDYRANVPYLTQPKVLESYLDDDGERVFILDNGREQPEVKYNAIWGKVKTKIMPKSYKGENCDSRPVK